MPSTADDQRPVIRVQRVGTRHPFLTGLAVALVAMGLILAVTFSAIAFQKQNSLSSQNRDTITQVQTVVRNDHAAADIRWCSLFGAILLTPRPPGPVTPASERFTDIIQKLSNEFKCT